MTNEREREYDGWPRSLVELASIIGREAALKVSMEYGGRSVYVPKTVIDGHPLAQLLGRDAFIALVSFRGGLELRDIPLMSTLSSKRRGIISFYKQHPDMTGRAIASELRTTERWVRQVLNERLLPEQRRLFGD
jgi:hypothetical protein